MQSLEQTLDELISERDAWLKEIMNLRSEVVALRDQQATAIADATRTGYLTGYLAALNDIQLEPEEGKI